MGNLKFVLICFQLCYFYLLLEINPIFSYYYTIMYLNLCTFE